MLLVKSKQAFETIYKFANLRLIKKNDNKTKRKKQKQINKHSTVPDWYLHSRTFFNALSFQMQRNPLYEPLPNMPFF